MPKKKPAEKNDAPKAAAGKTEAAQAATAAKVKKTESQIFTATGNEPGKKLAPQAQGIVNILKEAGKKGLSRADLVKAMDGVITTKQPQSRILSYYCKLLVESGAVTIEDAEPVAD